MTKDAMFAVNKQNHFRKYLGYASFILTAYDGDGPFHLYLKKYFSAHKKHGSKDRKYITSLCYHFFRLGSGAVSTDIEEKLLLATFLLEDTSSVFLQSSAPDRNEKIHANLPEKLSIAGKDFDISKLFPLKDELSANVDEHQFSKSFLKQPKLFIRIRPGYHQSVTQKLNAAGISYERENEDCFSFANNTKVSEVIKMDKEAVIQDYSSQRIKEFLVLPAYDKSPVRIWDCCAASGGKSILAYDILKDIQLTVSDTRKNILGNLHTRFAAAGIKNYKAFSADLSAGVFDAGKNSFDLIIADVPCSGSGTWSRTPEQLTFFHHEKITEYVLLQQQIVTNAIPYLSEGGYLLYITCSVFRKENEENVNFMREKLNLKLVKDEYLSGYQMQADTLFAALFRK